MITESQARAMTLAELFRRLENETDDPVIRILLEKLRDEDQWFIFRRSL